jgi:hypothetical protein
MQTPLATLKYHVTGAIERGEKDSILGIEIKETIDGKWMILCNGFQWGEPPLDTSGCSSQVWDTKELALMALHEQLAF